jgi:hypothetical protein
MAAIGLPVFLNPFRGSTAGAPIAEPFCGSARRMSCSVWVRPRNGMDRDYSGPHRYLCPLPEAVCEPGARGMT